MIQNTIETLQDDLNDIDLPESQPTITLDDDCPHCGSACETCVECDAERNYYA